MSGTDCLVGSLLHLSTMQCPSLAKAWFQLAGWCYKWGRKSVDAAASGASSVQLSDEERAAMLELIPRGTSEAETNAVLTVLSQVHSRRHEPRANADTSQNIGEDGEGDEDIVDAARYDDGTETTRRQLMAACMSLQVSFGMVDKPSVRELN